MAALQTPKRETVTSAETKSWTTTTWKRVRRTAVFVLSLVACAAVGDQAQAVENGNPQWPVGVQTIIPAILPAAGETAYFNYTLYYHADNFKGANGNDLIPGFEANVLAEAPRIVHTWESKLGPLNMSTGAILVGNFVKVEADPVPGVHLEDSATGLNFLYFTPLYLTYNTPTLHLLYGPSAIIPAGPFSKHDLANPTNGYYSFHQEFAFTYFPKKTFEISSEAELTFNAKILTPITNPAPPSTSTGASTGHRSPRCPICSSASKVSMSPSSRMTRSTTSGCALTASA